MYAPPFTISAKAINLISEISACLERFVIRMESETALLRTKLHENCGNSEHREQKSETRCRSL